MWLLNVLFRYFYSWQQPPPITPSFSCLLFLFTYCFFFFLFSFYLFLVCHFLVCRCLCAVFIKLLWLLLVFGVLVHSTCRSNAFLCLLFMLFFYIFFINIFPPCIYLCTYILLFCFSFSGYKTILFEFLSIQTVYIATLTFAVYVVVAFPPLYVWISNFVFVLLLYFFVYNFSFVIFVLLRYIFV